MKSIHCRFKTTLILTIFFATLVLASGCSPDPMVSYVRELEEKNLVQAFEELDADLNDVNSYFDDLFAKDIDDLQLEDIDQAKIHVAAIKMKLAEIKATADEIEAGSDANVREAIAHFNATFYYMDKMIDEIDLLFDLGAEIVTVYGDAKNEKISYSAFSSEMSRIEESLNQAAIRVEAHGDNMDQSFGKWEEIVDQALNK